MEKHKSIKVKDSTYRKLSKLAAHIQNRYERPVTLDEALDYAIKQANISRVSDTAGGWVMSDSEVVAMMETLREAWSLWKPRGSA